MTRKDFQLIADCMLEARRIAIAGYGERNTHEARVAGDALANAEHALARALIRTNPRFNRERFLSACRGEK